MLGVFIVLFVSFLCFEVFNVFGSMIFCGISLVLDVEFDSINFNVFLGAVFIMDKENEIIFVVMLMCW